MFSVVIVIPAYNELETLRNLIKKLKNEKILVINDGSSDGTKNFLKKKKISHINNKKNIGYDKSLIKAFKFLQKKNRFNYIITMDADNEHDPRYIEDIKRKIHKKKIDFLICKRSRYNRIIEKIISHLFYKKYKIYDPFSGFKVYKSIKLFSVLDLVSDKYFLAEIIPFFIKRDYIVRNFNIKSNNLKNRISKAGTNFIVNLKMFNFLKKYCI